MQKRDPKTFLDHKEVKSQMGSLEHQKSKLKNQVEDLNKKIHDLRLRCPHVNTTTYSGYDEDTEVCKDCGGSW
jgi:uncharacterized protein YeeX (DUF496 family)